MKHIWKFNLKAALGEPDPVYHHMPKNGRIIHVHTQDDVPCIWVEFDEGDEFVDRGFCIAGTGWVTSSNTTTYVGTTHQGPFVWHIYEVMS